MKKYRTRWNEIIEVEVERETSHFLVINGRKNAKSCGFEQYWDTREDAVSFILKTQREKVEAAEKRLASERATLVKLEQKYTAAQP